MSELGIKLETRERINKKVYRLGFEAQPLLIILSSLLVVLFVLSLTIGYVGFLIWLMMVLFFARLTSYMTKELEKGNTRPIDELLEKMVQNDSIYDDGAIEMLKSKNNKQQDEKIKPASSD